MLNNEVKEIAFEIAKKFKVSFDYQYIARTASAKSNAAGLRAGRIEKRPV